MLDPKSPPDELVRSAGLLYEDTHDFYVSQRWFDEHEADYAYRDGDQWSKADRDYLESQQRPVLTFNVILAKLLHLIGAQEDNLQAPVVVPHNYKDELKAEALEALKVRIYSDQQVSKVDAKVFDDGVTGGIGLASIDAYPDPIDPASIKVEIRSVSPQEVIFDPNAVEPDRSDARFLFWSKWLTKAEFKSEYPEHASYADKLMSYKGSPYEDDKIERPDPSRPEKYRWARGGLFVDRRRNMIRVVRMEYRCPKKTRVLVDPESGISRPVTEEQSELMRELGPDLQEHTVWRDEYYWLEFCGAHVLFNDVSPVPIDGYTITAYVCHQDRNGLPFGKVRPMRSPQQEVNKRFSQTLHLLTTQTQPGLYAETGALVDERQARDSMKEAGGVTLLNNGAIGRVQERRVAQLPETIALHQAALKMVDAISGVWVDQLEGPRSGNEAAAPAMLKYRQGLMSMRPVMRGFEVYQRSMLDKVLQVVRRAMPDHQIANMLGDHARFTVQDGRVTDAERGREASVTAIRDTNYKIELRPAEINNSMRMIEFGVLTSLIQLGIPIDPSVLFETAPFAPEKKDKLLRHAREAMQAQAQAAQQQAQVAERQLEREHQVDMMGVKIKAAQVAESSRHNLVTEMLDALKGGANSQQQMTQLWAQADMEQKRNVVDLVKTIIQMLGRNREAQMKGEQQQMASAQQMDAEASGSGSPAAEA